MRFSAPRSVRLTSRAYSQPVSELLSAIKWKTLDRPKGLFAAKVTRVLTPGLTEEPGILKAEENHFVVAVAAKGDQVALAAFDLSTGDLQVTQTSDVSLASQELRRLEPKEVLVS